MGSAIWEKKCWWWRQAGEEEREECYPKDLNNAKVDENEGHGSINLEVCGLLRDKIQCGMGVGGGGRKPNY